MKKIGDVYTIRGQFLESEYPEITLFDGRFDTGFKILDFVVAGGDPTDATEDCHAKLMTKKSTGSGWNFADVTQIAWAVSENRVSMSPVFGRSIVDPDNLVGENLWLRGNTAGDAPINYMITMQKYEFNEWNGALAMVRNKAQGTEST